MRHHISLTTVHGPRREDKKYVLEVWTQPWLRWVIGNVYHWFDMRVFKVPGFKRLERWLWSRHKSEGFYIPLAARMDIHCYRLRERGRTLVSLVQVSKAQYDEIRKSLYARTTRSRAAR